MTTPRQVGASPGPGLEAREALDPGPWRPTAIGPGPQPTFPLAVAPWIEKYELRPRHQSRRLYALAKRCLDLILLMAVAPVLLPLLLVCALAVKLEDPGAPAFFRQLRTGRAGKRFRMWKLRSMVRGAEDRKSELAAMSDRHWPDFKLRDDPRVTRLGRWLRRTSLDELPQMLNILRGDMSLVGPRPTSFGPETYADWQLARLEAPPGVTGLWQVSRRGSSEFDERVRIDLAYLERRCLLLDLEILARTLPVLWRADSGSW